MGQFLWKEEKVPQLPLLDAMCAFLTSGDPDFSYAPGQDPLRLADYYRSERFAALSRRAQPAEDARAGLLMAMLAGAAAAQPAPPPQQEDGFAEIVVTARRGAAAALARRDRLLPKLLLERQPALRPLRAAGRRFGLAAARRGHAPAVRGRRPRQPPLGLADPARAAPCSSKFERRSRPGPLEREPLHARGHRRRRAWRPRPADGGPVSRSRNAAPCRPRGSARPPCAAGGNGCGPQAARGSPSWRVVERSGRGPLRRDLGGGDRSRASTTATITSSAI